MSSVPRIARAVPKGPITRPDKGLAVIARLRWANGQDVDVEAVAIAWTRDAVEILWEQTAGEGQRQDWVPAAHIRRPGAPVPANTDAPNTRGRSATVRR